MREGFSSRSQSLAQRLGNAHPGETPSPLRRTTTPIAVPRRSRPPPKRSFAPRVHSQSAALTLGARRKMDGEAGAVIVGALGFVVVVPINDLLLYSLRLHFQPGSLREFPLARLERKQGFRAGFEGLETAQECPRKARKNTKGTACGISLTHPVGERSNCRNHLTFRAFRAFRVLSCLSWTSIQHLG